MDHITNLTRNYRSVGTNYQVPIRRLSAIKRKLASAGLPAIFANADKSVTGRIELSDRGELVVYFGDNKGGAYRADAGDEAFIGCELTK